MADNKKFNWLWPYITDTETAQKASQQGYWACIFCAAATILLVAINYFGTNLLNFTPWALLDAFLFIIIGWGIFKMNRFAAVAGLALYIIERISMWAEHGPKNFVMAIIITLMFINSVRGVFAYNKYLKKDSSMSSV